MAQTEAPINEVLAAGIILKSGWRGDCPLVDPMCGSGTFLIEAALIAAGINPGVYRRRFAFESWPDFDAELFDSIYNDDSSERRFDYKIYGADISPKAVAIATENIKSAGVGRYINLEVRPLSQWKEAPENGVLITNPPYGERISADDMDGLYAMIGTKLKHVFKGYHAWIIGYHDEYFKKIGLAPSLRMPLYNGALECELREYIMFEGDYKSFRKEGGAIHFGDSRPEKKGPRKMKMEERRWGDDRKGPRRESGKREFGRKDFKRDFKRDFKSDDNASTPSSENPLSMRRNENALKMLVGKTPQLPSQEGPLMRPRRGWKKKP